MSTSKSPSSPTSFEFTKRKRWADLLVHELSDAVVFVLSPDAHIWFCSRAVGELLGWSEGELIDRPFIDLVNLEDQRAFYVAFDESLRTRIEVTAHLRLKARSPISPQNIPQSEVLFEVKGFPYFIDNELVARCVIAIARPFPSRNVAIVNTILELKMENERLQTRLAELRVRVPSPSVPISPSPSPVCSLRPLSASRSSVVPPVSLRPSDASVLSCSQHRLPDSFGATSAQLQDAAYEQLGLHAYSGQHPSALIAQPTDDDLGDDISKRKKIRKSHNVEQYVCVTCGRTDSPEWRKGPQGPKTLCNACGLRWAKEVRSKVEEITGST